MKNLIAYLETFHPLSDGLKSYLTDNLVPASFPTRHMLLEVPKVASHLYYLSDGFAMSYTLNREGKVTENFWKKGQIIVAFESFVYQRPSFEVIQLLSPSDLLCLSYDKMQEMYTAFPETNLISRLLISQHCMRLKRRVRMMKYGNYQDQYRKLLEHYPNLERIVTQRSIATYLGITPQSLGRIKREIQQRRRS
jgi:CRP-like cAMP-binding protein